jgi:hypothetical protein
MESSERKTISIEGAVCLIVALINLALDQADIHFTLISWISTVACLGLGIDILRRTKWVTHPNYGEMRSLCGSGVIAGLALAFGLFLTFR